MNINNDYRVKTLSLIDNTHNLLYNKLHEYFDDVDIQLSDTLTNTSIVLYNEISYSIQFKDVINPQHILTKWDANLLESVDILYNVMNDTSSVTVIFNIENENFHKVLFSPKNIVSYLKFELEIKDFVEDNIVDEIRKTYRRRKELLDKMSNVVDLKGADYREHIFKNMILPKYVIYIESEINNFFKYANASKRFAGKIILDDLLYGNINTVGKDNMCFTILLAMDNPETIVNNTAVQYDEYMELIDNHMRYIDETHYIIKIVLFSNIDKSKHFFDAHHNDRYFRKFDDDYNNEKKNENAENKMNEFYDHIKNKMLPKLCEMWNKDIDIYIIENNMDESNFKD